MPPGALSFVIHILEAFGVALLMGRGVEQAKETVSWWNVHFVSVWEMPMPLKQAKENQNIDKGMIFFFFSKQMDGG